jgi:hypothetical protein
VLALLATIALRAAPPSASTATPAGGLLFVSARGTLITGCRLISFGHNFAVRKLRI